MRFWTQLDADLLPRFQLDADFSEKRTGLLRCYISRVENGHGSGHRTLEKMAGALEIPMYQLFYDGEELPVLPSVLKRKAADENAWGTTGKDARYLNKLRNLIGKSDPSNRRLLLHIVQKMARR